MAIQLAQLILSLSILIVLHELGHFLPAIAFKTRVEKFYLFFDPWFSIFKKKIGHTEVGLGWLPLGGYVKIAGMVDESMDTEALKEPAKPWEFRSKKPWQRLVILLGGVTVNFLLAIVIYAGVMAYWGKQYVATEDLKYGIWALETGEKLGLQSGDRIVSVNGKSVPNFSAVQVEILLGGGGTVEVNRNGSTVSLPITDAFIKQALEAKEPLAMPRVPFVVDQFSAGSGAEKAGLQKGDSLVALNGQPLSFYDEYLKALPALKGQQVQVDVVRNGQAMTFPVQLSDAGKMGIGPVFDLSRYYAVRNETFGGFAAVGEGWNVAVERLTYYVRQFKVIFSPETGAYKEVGGFYAILKQYPDEWDWRGFWEFTAFLSIMLGFLNVLPIPALDGGHAVFVIIEMITGKAPSTRILEVAQTIGFVLLLGLLIYANGNDILRALE
jgi:regulator of sigma E protease